MTDQELKLKFFGLHLGCPLVRGGSRGTLQGISIDRFEKECAQTVFDGLIATVRIDNCYLLLKPLSEITDEEAIAALSPIAAGEIGFEEFREMVKGSDKKANPNWKVKVEKYDKADDGYWLVEIRLTEDTYIVLYDDGTLFYHWNGETRPVDNSGFVFDFLRSKGYVLPYMGKDPFKEGWAVPAKYKNKDTCHAATT